MVQVGSPSGQGASLPSSLWGAPGRRGSRFHAETCLGISTSESLPSIPTPPPTQGASCRRRTARCPLRFRSGWTGTPWSSHSPGSAVNLFCPQEHSLSPRQAFCKFTEILDMLRCCLVHAVKMLGGAEVGRGPTPGHYTSLMCGSSSLVLVLVQRYLELVGTVSQSQPLWHPWHSDHL